MLLWEMLADGCLILFSSVIQLVNKVFISSSEGLMINNDDLNCCALFFRLSFSG